MMAHDIETEMQTFVGPFENYIIKMTGSEHIMLSLSPVAHLAHPNFTEHVKWVFSIT
jgi:hypothetical protein